MLHKDNIHEILFADDQVFLADPEDHLHENITKLKKSKLNSVALVRKRTIPTERPPLVGDVSANLCG
jgi:hypothetical protein